MCEPQTMDNFNRTPSFQRLVSEISWISLKLLGFLSTDVHIVKQHSCSRSICSHFKFYINFHYKQKRKKHTFRRKNVEWLVRDGGRDGRKPKRRKKM